MPTRPRRNTDATLQESLPFDPQEHVRITTAINRDARGHHRLNQYFIGPRIGKGKHGIVCLCKDQEMNGFDLAVKMVKRTSPNDRMKLLRRTYQEDPNQMNSTMNSIRKEIAIMKKCRHANLVRLVEIVDDPSDEKIYMIMENLSGGRVEWHTRSGSRPLLTIQQTQRIMRDIILGLEYLHHEGIIHRDIKPDNIIYTRDQRTVKLIDFGVAHYTPSTRSEDARQLPSEVSIDPSLFPVADLQKRVGTPTFLAPEVVWFPEDEASSQTNYARIPKERPPITKAIDIWSLGVTFYCFLFGEVPFQVTNSAYNGEYMLYNVICTNDWTPNDYMGADRIPTGGRYPQNSGLESSMVVYILDRMLQKNPDNRITLPEIKANPWILKNIDNPEEWSLVTSPGEGNRPASSSWIKNASMKLFKFIPNPR